MGFPLSGPRHCLPAPPTNPNERTDRVDATYVTIFINALLDMAWPVMPAHVLDQFTYV